MPYIRPNGEQIKRIAESDLDGPVVMLNLLKYDRTAGEAGAESYQRYGDEMRTIMESRGVKLLWRGRADSVLIGDDDADDWDTVLLVEYPSRKAFLEMSRARNTRAWQASDSGAGRVAADRDDGAVSVEGLRRRHGSRS